MAKDETWFQSVKWTKSCLECQKESNNTCSSRSCAELHYDDNGNPIPADSVGYDGDYQCLDNVNNKCLSEDEYWL